MDDPEPSQKTKNNWRMTGIILIVVAVLLTACGGFFIWKSIDQQSEIKDLKNQVKELEKNINKTGDPDGSGDAESLSCATNNGVVTCTTEGGYVFDYPEGWRASSEHRGSGGTLMTTITTKNGYEIFLTEAIAGAGGICVPETASTVTVHKEANGKISGSSVISYSLGDKLLLMLSSYAGKYDVLVNECDVFGVGSIDEGYSMFANYELFGGQNSGKPSESEYSQVVQMLANLRQK